MDSAPVLPAPGHGKPQFWDLMFLLLLAACLLGAIYVGVLAYREGAKTEVTKRSGEAWLEWFSQQSSERSTDAYPHPACAARPGAKWGSCLAHLIGEGGPLHGQRNAFNGSPIRTLGGCGAADRSVAGHVALELVTPLPPGAAIPFIVVPLAEDASIADKVTLRVSICELDGSAIRVGETEF